MFDDMALRTVPNTTSIEDLLAIMREDGAVIVQDFLTPELHAEFQEALKPYEDHKVYASNATDKELGEGFFPKQSQRIYGLMGKIPSAVVQVIQNPIWQGIMDGCLSRKCQSWQGNRLITQETGYMLASTAALRVRPGATAQPLHRDQLAFGMPWVEGGLETPMIGCLIAGSRAVQRNGATCVIPGSHKWTDDRGPKVEEQEYAEMETRSALFTLGTTYHGSGANVCDDDDPLAVRTLYAVFAQRDTYRQDQDEMLTTPLEIAKHLPENVKQICGYRKSRSGLGYVIDHQEPAEYLFSPGYKPFSQEIGAA